MDSIQISMANYKLLRRAQRWERLFNKNHIYYTRTAGDSLLVPSYIKGKYTRVSSDESAFALNESSQFSFKAADMTQSVARVRLTESDVLNIIGNDFLMDYVFQNLMQEMESALWGIGIGPDDRSIGPTRGTFSNLMLPSEANILMLLANNDYEIRFFSNCMKYEGPNYKLLPESLDE